MLTGRQRQRQLDVPQGRGSPFLPSQPPQPHPSLAPPQDSSPNAPHRDSRLLGILISASQTADSPHKKKTKNKKNPQLFPLNLLLLLYLFLMLFSDFNTCFKNSPALRRPQILSLLQLVPDECFTCFHCCLRST